MRQRAPAAQRNRDPILEVLRRVLPTQGRVLEIASGTGEHAVHFAAALGELEWQPSDPSADARESIAAWCEHADLANLRPPIELDVRAHPWPVTLADAIVNINMIHISAWDACLNLMRGASRLLQPGAILYMYGPYKVDGAHTAPSNAAFDVSLQSRDPSWGVRDVRDVESAARAQGFVLSETVAMPANNLSLVFIRGA